VSSGKLEMMFDELIAVVAQSLLSFGFVRRGKVLKSVSNGNAEIIEFQKSDKSTENRVMFTINLGLVCGALLDQERMDIHRSTILDAHLRNRLGSLLEPANDTWWDLTPSTEIDSLAAELSSLLSTKGVPYLENYKNSDQLIALWESGKSPGLTAVQRARLLSELKEAKQAR
jgi:hypothetical protein